MSKTRDSEIRMYVSGRLDRKGTDRIEQAALADRGTQARLDALRHQAIALRQAFSFPEFDLSRVQVGVRARSPYRALGIPPAAALWLQVIGMAVLFALLHRTGAYVAPPEVSMERSEGRVLVDSRPLSAAHRKRVVINQEVKTAPNSQATLLLDHANRVALAPETTLIVHEPRESVRQVLGLAKGEVWARFTAAGQKFAVLFGRGAFEVSGTTAEFDLIAGERALAMLPLNLPDDVAGRQPVAVLRVFRGAVMTRLLENRAIRGEMPPVVSRDQWMVFYATGEPASGDQGGENFKLLRIDQAERFKDNLHWLATDSYPLRAENNTLELERRLRSLARGLLEFRNQHVVRVGRTEVMAFDREMRNTIAAARERVASGNPLPEDRLPPDGALRMHDADLVAAAPLIEGILSGWVSRAESYATLGSAAKTLLARSQQLESELTQKDQELVKALVLKEDMEKLRVAIAGHDADIEALKASPNYDPDGAKRKTLDGQIAAQRGIEKAGAEARGKVELARFKLNAVESRMDDARRARAPLAQAVADKQAALDAITEKQKANPYTDSKLAQAREAAEDLRSRLAGARETQSRLEEDAKAMDKLLGDDKKTLEADVKAAREAADAATAADGELADARTALDEKRAAVADAEKEVQRIQKQIDALPEGERSASPLQQDLKKAKTRLNEAKAAEKTAATAADDAQASSDAAAKKLGEARDAQTASEKKVAKVEADLAAKRTEIAQAKKDAEAVEASLKVAEDEVSAQLAAKAELEKLAHEWGLAADTLSKAKFELEDQDIAIKALDDEAAPLRDELAAVLKAIEDGEGAKAEIRRLDTEKQKSEAVEQDIARRTNIRAAQQAQYDEIKARPLVSGYDKLLADYKTQAAERAAIEYLRARALQEDNAHHARQKAALHQYNDAARKAEEQAIAYLDAFCAPYREFSLADNEAAAAAARRSILETLWRLYYTGEPELRADGRAMQCYYVLAETGGSAEALRELDVRWSTALSIVLGKERFEAAVRLAPTDLLSQARK